MKKAIKKEIEKNLAEVVSKSMPKLKVVLKRLPNKVVLVDVCVIKGKIFIYDMFANKTYSIKHYGKTWALTKGDLEL